MDRGETIGLGVSTAGHALLVAALAIGLMRWQHPAPIAPPSIEVALADDVALESRTTSQAEAAAAQAAELGPLEPDAAPPPPPNPALAEPKPDASKAKPTPDPRKAAQEAEERRAALTQAMGGKPGANGRPARAQRLGDDFLKGLDSPAAKPQAAAEQGADAPISPAATRALNAAITRQIKPFWKSPSGADVEQLVTIVSVSLNPDGTLSGPPRVLRQSGITASNAGQRQLHGENALRAVRLAAPFTLPLDLYDAWQSLEIRFDKRLNQ